MGTDNKSCTTCKYVKLDAGDNPCIDCTYHNLWVPNNTETVEYVFTKEYANGICLGDILAHDPCRPVMDQIMEWYREGMIPFNRVFKLYTDLPAGIIEDNTKWLVQKGFIRKETLIPCPWGQEGETMKMKPQGHKWSIAEKKWLADKVEKDLKRYMKDLGRTKGSVNYGVREALKIIYHNK